LHNIGVPQQICDLIRRCSGFGPSARRLISEQAKPEGADASFLYSECSTLLPFINAGKAVFEVEYRGQPSKFCPKANAMKLSSIKKNLSLDAAPLIQCN
jgi:hypothetical protein